MNTRKLRKAILTLCSALLLVSLSVGATLAYLTSETKVVKNTFTIGSVEITLDEADVNEYGELLDENGNASSEEDFDKEHLKDRVTENEYKLMPNHEYIKDPTVHVKKGSEPAYVRMIVTINDIADLRAACDVPEGEPFLPENFVTGWESDIWQSKSFVAVNDTVVCEFWYHTDVDARNIDTDYMDLEPLFATIKVPENATNDEIAALDDLEINIIAQAIQSDNFESAEEAWAAWEE